MLMVFFLLSRLRLLICKNDRGGSDVVLQGPFRCHGLKRDHPLTKPHTRPAPHSASPTALGSALLQQPSRQGGPRAEAALTPTSKPTGHGDGKHTEDRAE